MGDQTADYASEIYYTCKNDGHIWMDCVNRNIYKEKKSLSASNNDEWHKRYHPSIRVPTSGAGY